MLPLELQNIGGREINFVSFTPGTTFDLKSSTGIVKERALIYQMLKGRFTVPPTGLRNLLQGNVGFESWRRWINGEREDLTFNKALRRDFVKAIQRDRGLRKELEELCRLFRRRRDVWPIRLRR